MAESRAIRFANVSKGFALRDGGRTMALEGISLDIAPSQFVALVGPSGCGKSTLLRLTDGLLTPDAGTVQIGGLAPVPGPDTGMVFQNFRLMPWRSALDNVAFALEGRGLDRSARRTLAREHLRRVGLEAWSEHFPAQLSGGMRQRVALARALVGEPDILLMDEPFASLDAQTRELMQEDLLARFEAARPTVLFVTHSVDEALLLADRIVVMGAGGILDDVEIDFPRPRRIATIQQLPDYAALRTHLWSQIRQLVLAEPSSAFFGR